VPDFFDVVRSQRACREFTSRPVTDALVEQVLSAATFAPSAENKQPWVFVVVRDNDTKARIGELTRAAWRGGARAYSEGRLSPTLLAEVDRGAEGAVAAAPVIVVVCGDAEQGLESTMPSSIFPAVQNLLLACTASGLGSALTTLTTRFGDELRDLLELPSSVRPMVVVPIGWPARPMGPPRRSPVASKTYRDRFGVVWDNASHADESSPRRESQR
jgi:nitroreductase